MAKCNEWVYGGSFRGHQCRRDAVVEGTWCKQHSPEAKAKKRAAIDARIQASQEQYAADRRAKERAEAHRQLHDEMLATLREHKRRFELMPQFEEFLRRADEIDAADAETERPG